MRGSISGIVLIVIGAILLAQNLGFLDISLIQILRTWWPIVLIALGISFFFTPNGRRR